MAFSSSIIVGRGGKECDRAATSPRRRRRSRREAAERSVMHPMPCRWIASRIYRFFYRAGNVKFRPLTVKHNPPGGAAAHPPRPRATRIPCPDKNIRRRYRRSSRRTR
jgi:hypothetical protein